jgi:hypothetical protein
MMSHNTPLESYDEVWQEVMAGTDDKALAHGAAVVAQPKGYLLLDTPAFDEEKQLIVGVTAASVDRLGTTTLRTAVFGNERYPDIAAAVDANGVASVVQHSVKSTDNDSIKFGFSVANIKRTLAWRLPRNERSIGGVIMTLDPETDALAIVPFVTNVCVRAIEASVQGKLVVPVLKRVEGYNDQTFGKGLYMAMIRGVRKRGEPVVIDKSFETTL